MPLLDRTKMPPGGFYYREPSVNWSTSNAYLPFDMIVGEIQAVRVANPVSGLDPTTVACEEALDTYTCARLKNDSKWCSGGVVAAAVAASRKVSSGCSSCGAKRKRTASTMPALA